MLRRQRIELVVEAERGGIDDIGIDPGVGRDTDIYQEAAIGTGADTEMGTGRREGLEVVVAKEGTGDIEVEVRTGREGG
jgi:hypothetical protein